jgi:hypothetical protein
VGADVVAEVEDPGTDRSLNWGQDSNSCWCKIGWVRIGRGR